MGRSVACLAALVLSAATAPALAAPAQQQEGEEEPAGGGESDKELTAASPAQLIPKLELRHQFLAFEGGGRLQVTTLRLDILFLRKALLRFDLPRGTLEKGGVERTGFGDIQVQLLTLITSGQRQASLVFAGVTVDSATWPELGTGKQVVDFGAGGALKPARFWLMYALFDQQLSFAGQEARPNVNSLNLMLGNILFGPRRDWFTLILSPNVDFENELSTLSGAVETGRLLSGRVGLFVRAGTQLAGRRQVDYWLGAGFRYLFTLPAAVAAPKPQP